MGSLWPRSGTIERYGADDLRATGALAYFFSGGTTTPFTVYADAAESQAHTHPVVADTNGRWPDVFVPYTVAYDVQVKTAQGVQITFTQLIPNPNPVDVSVIIPPENQVQTGMIHAEFINNTKTGFVRLNGRTLGNGASGATERANSDTSALFTYLWNNLADSQAPVSGGRGASGAADFAANKTITLPDMRGQTFHGLDDMGNAAAGAYGSLVFSSGNPTTVGSKTGANGVALTTGNLPAHTHTGNTNQEASHTHGLGGHTHGVNGSTGSASNDHTHTFGGTTGGQSADHTHGISPTAAQASGLYASGALANAVVAGASSTQGTSNNHTHDYSGTTAGSSASHSHVIALASGGPSGGSDPGSPHAHSFTTDATGTNTEFNNLGLTLLITWFIKL